MIKMFTNLTKAAVAVAATPITAVADTVMLIDDATKLNKPAFGRTARMLKKASEALDEAVKPERE